MLPPQWSSTVWLLCCSLADEVHQIPAISLGLDEQQSCKLHLCKPTQAEACSLLNQPNQEPKTRLPDIGPCLDFLQNLLKIIAKQGPSFGAILGPENGTTALSHNKKCPKNGPFLGSQNGPQKSAKKATRPSQKTCQRWYPSGFFWSAAVA